MPASDVWNACAVPWKLRGQRRPARAARATSCRPASTACAERDARAQVERDGHRRQLAEVVDGERADRRARCGATDASGTSCRRSGAHVQQRQRVGVALVLRRDLQDHPVLVARRVDGGDLARTVGVVQRVLDLLGGDAERGRLVAVDVDARPAGCVICRSLVTSMKSGQRAHAAPRGAAPSW